MTKEEKDKVIERIKALLRLGDTDRNNSEEEAQVAAKKAQELINKYNIDMSEVSNIEEVLQGETIVDEVAYSKRSTRASWERYLASAVGLACGTRPWIYTDAKEVRFNFIGFEWDVAISKELFNYLHSYMTKLARQKYKDNKNQRDYLNGFVIRIFNRIKEQDDMNKFKASVNQKYGMVLVNKKNIIDKWAEEHHNFNQKLKKKHHMIRQNNAYLSGYNDGGKVDIGTENRIKVEERNQLS